MGISVGSTVQKTWGKPISGPAMPMSGGGHDALAIDDSGRQPARRERLLMGAMKKAPGAAALGAF